MGLVRGHTLCPYIDEQSETEHNECFCESGFVCENLSVAHVKSVV